MAFPYDPFVPITPTLAPFRRDIVRHAGPDASTHRGDDLYRIVDAGSGAVVMEGSRDACLDHVISAWWDTAYVPVRARPSAEAAALRLRFERYDRFADRWVPDTAMSDAVVDMHFPI